MYIQIHIGMQQKVMKKEALYLKTSGEGVWEVLEGGKGREKLCN